MVNYQYYLLRRDSITNLSTKVIIEIVLGWEQNICMELYIFIVFKSKMKWQIEKGA